MPPETYKDFRKAGESLWVPNWSTSLRIPRTLLSILKTCIDKEDWRLMKEASSGDWTFLAGDSTFDRPASTSWKLMAGVWVGSGQGTRWCLPNQATLTCCYCCRGRNQTEVKGAERISLVGVRATSRSIYR